ncbi:MAG: N-succinyldiaminopimelate aminotransferase, partial [Frankiales bacterium]|nr:N-succinyldiaminopimelate aminotransferase [Frankiales bacterium]
RPPRRHGRPGRQEHRGPLNRPGWAARARLPEFPWDRLAPYGERARAHQGGVVDLSIGTPVDPTPDVVQQALRDAADAPGYPLTIGTPAVREALVAWSRERLGADVDARHVVPSIGSKELVALLPVLLGLAPGSTVLIPELAYPTYDAGARLAGCVPVATDDPTSHDPSSVSLVWVNSPSNPTGRVLPADELARVVAWAREHDVLVASDECYLELGWDAEPVSVLHPSVSGGSTDGVLALHSLSKRSNLAGYRAGFAVGDEHAVAALVEARKHIGLLSPAPVQAALVAALGDSSHVVVQKERYRARRTRLRAAVEAAGFRVDHSEAGLYLWCTRDEACWDTVAALAGVGVLVAPGEFYGAAGARHVRMALTATDERIDAAVERLAAL